MGSCLFITFSGDDLPGQIEPRHYLELGTTWNLDVEEPFALANLTFLL